MAEALCPRSDLPVSSCAHCRPPAPVLAPTAIDPDDPLAGLNFGGSHPGRPGVGPVIVASMPGWCACRCGEYIDPDREDTIAMVEGQGWTLEDCL